MFLYDGHIFLNHIYIGFYPVYNFKGLLVANQIFYLMLQVCQVFRLIIFTSSESLNFEAYPCIKTNKMIFRSGFLMRFEISI